MTGGRVLELLNTQESADIHCRRLLEQRDACLGGRLSEGVVQGRKGESQSSSEFELRGVVCRELVCPGGRQNGSEHGIDPQLLHIDGKVTEQPNEPCRLSFPQTAPPLPDDEGIGNLQKPDTGDNGA